MHPAWRRCSSRKYSPYSRSSRLARRAPRPSRCHAGPSPRAPNAIWLSTGRGTRRARPDGARHGFHRPRHPARRRRGPAVPGPRPRRASRLRRLGCARRQRRAHAVVATRADHAGQRRGPQGGVDLSHGRRPARPLADPVQPDRRARRALRHVAAAQGLRPRRRHRPAEVGVRSVHGGRRFERARRQPRRRLLGGRRRARRPHPRRRRLHAVRARCRDRPADPELRHPRRRRPARRPRRPGQGAVCRRQHARHHLQGSADPGHPRRRRPRSLGAGLRPRL